MSNYQPLKNSEHAQLRMLVSHGPQFGDGSNQMPVVVTEFEEAQRAYPILFRKGEDDRLFALAILGFEAHENLFLVGDSWTGYVPAIIRRGPFAIHEDGEVGNVIVVDLDHPRIRQGGSEGLPIFNADGSNGDVLELALGALRLLHIGNSAADAMQSTFEELDLLVPMDQLVRASPMQTVNFEGYQAITHERIAALKGAQLEKLSKAGLLAPAIFAAYSLTNLGRLGMLKQLRENAAAET
jgi:hypothetical protein